MSRPLMVANRTANGGDVQMWLHEWQRVMEQLALMPGGPPLIPVIQDRIRAHRTPVKLRISLNTRQIAVVQHAWDRVT